MSEPALVRTAARNNAEWCDAICRTYGIAGRFGADSWSSPTRTPQYYPDAVTLLPGVAVSQILSGIDAGEGSSVKDSFADLDLAVAGFRPLFDAEWLHRAAGGSRAVSGRRWSTVTTEQQLGEWESTWARFTRGTSLLSAGGSRGRGDRRARAMRQRPDRCRSDRQPRRDRDRAEQRL